MKVLIQAFSNIAWVDRAARYLGRLLELDSFDCLPDLLVRFLLSLSPYIYLKISLWE